MKIFNLGGYELNDIGSIFKYFVKQMVKRIPVGFLCMLGIQYIFGSVFSFSVILKPKPLVYWGLSSVISLQLLLALG